MSNSRPTRLDASADRPQKSRGPSGLSFDPPPPQFEIPEGRYLVRFARQEADLQAVQRLRFEVFNLELNEGLASSYQTGLDQDEFDAHCHHLMVIEQQTGQAVGTYRMQCRRMARQGAGFYSCREYDLSSLPEEFWENAVELGRACIAKPHRSGRALFLLWKGLAAYLTARRKHYLFGCCSLTGQDQQEALRVMDYLDRKGSLHPLWRVPPQPEYALTEQAGSTEGEAAVKLPLLMQVYLRFGARICSLPALDRQFGTIDYLAVIDVRELDQVTVRRFFQ